MLRQTPTEMGFDAAGCRRFYRSLTTAFREMAERPGFAYEAATGEPDYMSRLAERLYGDYRAEVERQRVITCRRNCRIWRSPPCTTTGVRAENPR